MVDVLLVGQAGRVGYEALLCVASLRHSDPGFPGRVVVAEPQPGPLWPRDPRMAVGVRAALQDLGAEIRPMESRRFGAAYPQGNKMEALGLLEPGQPFLFLDSDMLVTGALSRSGLDPARPAASVRVRDTWPKPPLYGPSRAEIWAAVYDRAGVTMEPTLDPLWPPDHPQRYLYCNAGWVCGPCGPRFGVRWADLAADLRNDTPAALASQTLFPWLDQIALPPTLAACGGGRPSVPLDGAELWHYRTPALLYATAPDTVIDTLHAVIAPNRLKKHLKVHAPFHRSFWRGDGARARALFDRDRLPASEAVIRRRLRQAELWRR